MSDIKNISFEEWEARKLESPEFRAAVEELEPAYQVARLRIMHGLTQAELAKSAKTSQPSIARLESGQKLPSLSFLQRVASALGARVEVKIMPQEKPLSSGCD